VSHCINKHSEVKYLVRWATIQSTNQLLLFE